MTTGEPVVMAIGGHKTNAGLIGDCRILGYISDDGMVIDPTYGLGTFWRDWTPRKFRGSDLNLEKSPCGQAIDFTALPDDDKTMQTVVFDPPYKLAGKADAIVDGRYGVGQYASIEARHQLIMAGVTEAERVLVSGGHLLLKCQDQVASGKVHWQTILFANHAKECGLTLVDSLLFQSYRAQPKGRRQIHARRNYSTLLIFKK